MECRRLVLGSDRPVVQIADLTAQQHQRIDRYQLTMAATSNVFREDHYNFVWSATSTRADPAPSHTTARTVSHSPFCWPFSFILLAA